MNPALTAASVAMVTLSRLPSEDGSVISNESERLNSGRGSTMQKVTKEERNKRGGEHTHTHSSLLSSNQRGGPDEYE